MKPDVIVSWPDNNDYPLWRKLIRDNRHRFAKVIIVFTKTFSNSTNYVEFIKNEMAVDGCDFIDSRGPQGSEDWRDVAVNEGLKVSDAKYVWFTEQDFFPTHDNFWIDLERGVEYYKCEVVGVYEGTRLHPCSLLVERKIIDLTKKDFGIVPGVADHFAKFTHDLKEYATYTSVVRHNWKHYNGLSQNWTLCTQNQKPNWKPEEFFDYLKKSLECGIALHPEWGKIANKTLTSYNI